MSILIKGMQMPKECLDCPMCDINDDCVLQKDERFGTWEEQKKGCPLVEVPEPHGDLIDRDAFRADFSMGENCDKCGIELKRCEYDRIYTKMDFCGWLDDAPTVIEGSDDHADN